MTTDPNEIERAQLREMFFPERTRYRLSPDQRLIGGILRVFALILVPWCYAAFQWGTISGLEFEIRQAIARAEFRS